MPIHKRPGPFLLLLLGSILLLAPGHHLAPWLLPEEAMLAGLAILALGIALLQADGWLFHSRGGSSRSGPAKRMKIRIRCAR
ncbi:MULTISPECIES: hypothetical protein [Acetobacterales]|uniref:hypothetical protein n=1 Tax=Roseomonas sp. WGS1072 TaxID=3366816 RepID=UPI003BF42C77